MILVTGASGFIGRFAVPFLQKNNNVNTVSLQNISPSQVDYNSIKTIVHLAGMAHRMEAVDSDVYFKINHELTLDFALQAKLAGVSHFVYISTVKVYGDHKGIKYFDESSLCAPTDPYGESKWRAEKDLLTLVDDKFTVSIIRPPLVYGRDVKGNLQSLLGLVRKYPIIPFGGISNKRSMVYVGNLVALIDTIISKNVGGIFLAGDEYPHSTSELVDMIIRNANLKTKNLAIPLFLKKVFKSLKPEMYHRLFGDFIIDNVKTNKSLGFTPPFSFEEGVAEMVKN